jgi:hypothetical protein
MLGRLIHTQTTGEIEKRRMKRGKNGHHTNTLQTRQTRQSARKNWITPGGTCGLKELKAAKIKMNPADFHKLSSTIRNEHNVA